MAIDLAPEDSSLGRRSQFREYLREHFPTLADAAFGSPIEGGSPSRLLTPLPEEWRPTQQQLEAARAGLEQRRQETRWRAADATAIREHFSALLETYRVSLKGLSEVGESLGNVVGKPVLEVPAAEHEAFLTALATPAACFERRLLFAPDTSLITCFPPGAQPLQLRFLAQPERSPHLIPLAGQSKPIHDWNNARSHTGPEAAEEGNDDGSPAVDLETPQVAEDYLRFFCHHLSTDDGYFVVVESLDEILGPAAELSPELFGERAVEPLLRCLDRDDRDPISNLRRQLKPLIFPITRLSAPGEAAVRLCATVFYDGALFHAGFAVPANGVVEMGQDSMIELPGYPPRSHPFEPLRVRDGAELLAALQGKPVGEPEPEKPA